MSAIPAVLDALVSAAQGIAGVTVIKGPPLKAPHKQDVLLVGFRDGSPSVSYSSNIAGLGSSKAPFEVNNTITVWRGNTDVDPVIDRADQIMVEFRQAIAADMTLGGIVTRARVTDREVSLMQSPHGAVVETPFTVLIEGFRDSL